MSLRAGLRKGTKSSADGVAAFLRDLLEKTGRRLTSDPIRTSLGLLPSGPDPVGEWLVHRQSPGPYLGPKGSESKRGLCRHTPPTGLACGEPDDKLQRGIQYAAASQLHHEGPGIPDHPLSRMMTP